jgi:hypothetical protein
MMQSRSDRAIDVLATAGAVSLTGLGWLLSFAALRQLASTKGEPAWAASLWPACIDVAALVAGLVAIRARRRGRPDHYAEVLTGLFSAAVIAGNVVLAGTDPVAMAVHAAPAVTMLASWHLLLRLRRASVDTSAFEDETEDLRADVAETAALARPGADVSASPSPARPPLRPARVQVQRLVARHDGAVTVDMVRAKTGVSRRHAARLLAEARRPHVVHEAAP